MSYYWDGDRLLGCKIVEEPDDDEPNGTEIPVRIMYDSDGEAVGFLLGDAAPVYYGKNLQGDITALYDHEGNYIVGYIYDAYGNIVNFDIPTDESLPTGEQIGKMVVAFFYASFNPLSYRGYLYAPAIGLSYYLGSRFYCPAICRFLNADVYADTGTGAAGTNMFAYCNNNPVVRVDRNGKYWTDGSSALQPYPNEENAPSPIGISGIIVFFSRLTFFLGMVFGTSLATSPPERVQVNEADKKIQETLKKDKKNSYWIANVKSNYVKIGKALNRKEAVARLKKGKDVFTRTYYEAYYLALDASNKRNPVYHNKHKEQKGYYDHFHLYGHTNDAHVFFNR